MFTNAETFFEENKPLYNEDKTLLPDVFAFSRMFANDHVGKCSIEVRPSYISSMYSVAPFVAIAFTPQMAQHLHEWFADLATRDDFSFSFPPAFEVVEDGLFLAHLNES